MSNMLPPASTAARKPVTLPRLAAVRIDETEQASSGWRWLYSSNPTDLARVALEMTAAALPAARTCSATIPA